jgi:ABC-type multidrug transport system ATPase subunit
MNADLILVLDQGQIVQRGTHSELMVQEGIYRRIYDMQARIEDELEREIGLTSDVADQQHPADKQHQWEEISDILAEIETEGEIAYVAL